METLKQQLENFKGMEPGKDLTAIFKELSKAFLYGGFIKVGDDYEIYIRTVEFYFHMEDESFRDDIVYHRNKKFPGRTVPAFPLMTLHSHWSGFDITFEDPEGKYRASALIRAYSVYDVKAGGFVVWDTKNATRENPGSYSVEKDPVLDKRSTFLQLYLNGFSLDGTPNRVEWIDFTDPQYGDVDQTIRQGIKKENVGWDYKWNFSRKDRTSKESDLRQQTCK